MLHVLRAPVGGLFRHVCDLAKAQAAMGHQVGVVCDAEGDALTNARLEALRPHLALGLFRVAMSRAIAPSDLFAFYAIRAHALGLGVDVLHGHGAKGGAYSRLVGRSLKRMGRRLVSCYTPHGGSLHYHPASIQGRVYMGLERHLARSSDGIIFESAFSAGRYAAQVGTPACPTSVIPNGLTDADFVLVAPDADAADVLFVGELRHLKGVDVLIDALAQLTRDGRPLTATIVGDGRDRARFEAAVAAHGLSQAIRFTGALPARTAFALGRTLVLPSRAESLPYVVLEAAAAGLPIIATAVGGMSEIFGPDAGDLVRPDDSAALARAIAAAMSDRGSRHSASLRLKSRLRASFSVDAMTEAVLAGYHDALAQRRG